jgi:hypothetical protein
MDGAELMWASREEKSKVLGRRFGGTESQHLPCSHRHPSQISNLHPKLLDLHTATHALSNLLNFGYSKQIGAADLAISQTEIIVLQPC